MQFVSSQTFTAVPFVGSRLKPFLFMFQPTSSNQSVYAFAFCFKNYIVAAVFYVISFAVIPNAFIKSTVIDLYIAFPSASNPYCQTEKTAVPTAVCISKTASRFCCDIIAFGKRWLVVLKLLRSVLQRNCRRI